MNETILITGANGYLGWNLVVHLARINKGKIICVDNYIKEIIQRDNKVHELSPAPSLSSKINMLKYNNNFSTNPTNSLQRGCCDIKHVWADVSNPKEIKKVFDIERPTIIIHLAQQNSAPLSMDNLENSLLTNDINTKSTLTLLWCTKKYCPDALFILRGSINCYGRPGTYISEGKTFIPTFGGNTMAPFPNQPTSIMECSKTLSSLYAQFCAKTWKLNIVEFKQGCLYGFRNKTCHIDKSIAGSFCYDNLFGNCINKFVSQVVTSNPITVHGHGNQGVALLHLDDATESYCRVIRRFTKKQYAFFGIKKAKVKGFYKVINQITSIRTIKSIAENIVLIAADNFKLNPTIEYDKNYRDEKDSKDYLISANSMVKLGIIHTDDIFENQIKELISELQSMKEHINTSLFNKNIIWWKSNGI